MSVAILENNSILYKFEEEIKIDMASHIVPTIELSFNNVSFDINDIDKIFIVTGPGSFTGIRVGVTAAKTIAWALKKDIIPISSLEFLATTKVDAEYIVPMIDARRGYVFAGVYDRELKPLLIDTYIKRTDMDEYLSAGVIVSYDDIEGSVKPDTDILMIVEKHKNDTPINPHEIKPNYLKLTEAEEKYNNS
jgi:tRNA threonylcarbamoyl adenosine modification protein YeaZ